MVNNWAGRDERKSGGEEIGNERPGLDKDG